MHIDSIKHNGIQTCISENILESVGVIDLAIIHDENIDYWGMDLSMGAITSLVINTDR